MSSFNFTLEELKETLVEFPNNIQEQMIANFLYESIDSLIDLGTFLKNNNLGGFKVSCHNNVFKCQVYLIPINIYKETLLYV